MDAIAAIMWVVPNTGNVSPLFLAAFIAIPFLAVGAGLMVGKIFPSLNNKC